MHKLLQRQLLQTQGTVDVSKDWENFIDLVNRTYEEMDEEHTLIERTLEISSKELLQRNEEYALALEDLKKAQAQIVQSEKMAVLGQLIAGVSHEINTPAGAIMNATEEIKQDYNLLLGQLIYLVKKLSDESRELFFTTCNMVKNFNKNSNTSEERIIAKELEEILKEHDIPNTRMTSKNLATIGFTKVDLLPILPLLKLEEAPKINESLFTLGMTQIHVSDIKIAIERITSLVRALKLYSHVDSDTMTYTNLREDIENTLAILHSKLKKGVTVNKEFEEIPPVFCHADQLNQVWTNIINNAIEAMHGNGVIIIRVNNHPNDHVRIEIEDNGPGIPGEVMSRIFEYYFTTKDKGEGTGLGLSISKDIIDKHKGSISVESIPGKTLFQVILPVESLHEESI